MPKIRIGLIIILSALIISQVVVIIANRQQASAAPDQQCRAYSAEVLHRVNPETRASLLTTSEAEAFASESDGFTEDHGTLFMASPKADDGLEPVYRLANASSGDALWLWQTSEIESARTKYGYRDEGVAFYASKTEQPCLEPVHRYQQKGIHRYAVSKTDRQLLADAGWEDEGVAFHAKQSASEASAAATSTFRIAVFPDTQQEVLQATDPRFMSRTTWLAQNHRDLNLRQVVQVGDLVNWDTPDHIQYDRARKAMQVLGDARIPYAIAVGNHDAQATCEGGSACIGRDAKQALRDTSVFNAYFPESSFENLDGQYEQGKMDNSFQTFTVEEKDFLVLTLELWPRAKVVDWASSVVKAHPRHNVIIVTHSYLEADGKISMSNGGYGSNSPQYVFDHLVKLHPNIRVVLSGHTGTATVREDVGDHGNKIISYLQAFHDGETNPMRLLEIDLKRNTMKSWIYSPYTETNYPEYDSMIIGLNWI